MPPRFTPFHTANANKKRPEMLRLSDLLQVHYPSFSGLCIYKDSDCEVRLNWNSSPILEWAYLSPYIIHKSSYFRVLYLECFYNPVKNPVTIAFPIMYLGSVCLKSRNLFQFLSSAHVFAETYRLLRYCYFNSESSISHLRLSFLFNYVVLHLHYGIKMMGQSLLLAQTPWWL